ncbi:MAG: hypothetical protein ACLTZI_12150 [[Eubacterium] siraeum]
MKLATTKRELPVKCQAAPDTAMTVRMIMILLYGAGGEPGRGEIPMTRFRKP